MKNEEDKSHAGIRSRGKAVAGLFLALLISFASLLLGCLVENRDFSHLNRTTFNGFNAFLTSLWLVGLLTVVIL